MREVERQDETSPAYYYDNNIMYSTVLVIGIYERGSQ